jgi:hypothetical protein
MTMAWAGHVTRTRDDGSANPEGTDSLEDYIQERGHKNEKILTSLVV